MKKEVFKGAGVAIVTPFTKDGAINFNVLGEMIEWQIASGTDAIVICGTTGEASTLNDQEHISAVKYTVEKVAGRVPVIAGAGSNDARHGLELSKAIEAVGADALLHVTPYYNKTTQKGLVQHFKAMADAVKIPIVLYNVPSRTGLSIGIDTYKELAQVENIVATKEATGDIAYAAKIKAACGEDLDIYSGNDDMITPLLSIGGKGVISVLSNVMPKETHEICQSFFDGDAEKSGKLQVKYIDLIETLFCEVNPIPVKTALRLMGYEVGGFRMPLCEMTDANLEKLKTQLSKYNLI